MGDKLQANLNGLSGVVGQGGPAELREGQGASSTPPATPARGRPCSYTAAVPGALAVGFLILLVVFMLKGGYKQVHIEEHGGNAETATPQ